MASSASPQPARIAFRKPDDPAKQRAVEEYLATRAHGEATCFLPKDDDEMNTALSEGRFQFAVFADWDAMMEPVWKGEARLDAWKAAGVEIELVHPPAADPAAWRKLLDDTYRSLSTWRSRQARRQTIAACILSALALASLAVLFYLLPSPL